MVHYWNDKPSFTHCTETVPLRHTNCTILISMEGRSNLALSKLEALYFLNWEIVNFSPGFLILFAIFMLTIGKIQIKCILWPLLCVFNFLFRFLSSCLITSSTHGYLYLGSMKKQEQIKLETVASHLKALNIASMFWILVILMYPMEKKLRRDGNCS